MSDHDIARRIICSLLSALCIANIFAHIVGEERKKLWFVPRTRSWFFNRRGVLGARLMFGRPKTKEGLAVMGGMLLCVALSTYIIFLV
ncbi:MAG: hypothetical protein IJS96_10685 [Schwartzia sp.]|nr:hypothetical protein [Schwartzia sp. (in: firmicutes)]